MAYPWTINPLEYLTRRVSQPMLGQDPSRPQDPNKPNLPAPVAPAGVPDIPEGTVGIPTVTDWNPVPPHRSFWQRVKSFFGFGSAAAGGSMWGRPETLTRHFRDHGPDFNSSSEAEYVQQSQDFYIQSQEEGFPTKIYDGVIRVYDPETNTFGSYNMDGTSKTFFRPWWTRFTRGLYWSRQLGDEFPGGSRPTGEVEPEIPDVEIEIPIEPIP